jgi:hypothetical protein
VVQINAASSVIVILTLILGNAKSKRKDLLFQDALSNFRWKMQQILTHETSGFNQPD